MSAPDRGPLGAPPRRLMQVAVAGAVILAIGGGAAFYYAAQQNRPRTDMSLRVAVTADACDPNEITVPGGRRSFEIVNVSDRPIEWEILDGVMVVAERENIAPGFRQTLTAQLAPGTYAITCGLLSNPRGVLHVTDSEEARTVAATVNLRSFLGPLSEYKVYLVQQAAMAIAASEALTAAIEAGDLDNARALWLQARAPYKRVEPLAYRFSDLEAAIDPVADYLAQRETDPGFSGFHRLEFGLFAKKSTDGLTPVAHQLTADLRALQDRLAKTKLDPALLLALPGDMASQLAQGRILTGEDHYAGSDLADIASNLDGISKIVQLLQSVLKPVDTALAAEIDTALNEARAALASLAGQGGFPVYAAIDAASRKALSQKFQQLADALGRLDAVIGVS